MSTRSFRLATVLRVRQVQEESARGELLRSNRHAELATRARENSALRYRTTPVSVGAVPEAVFHREQVIADMAAATLLAADGHLDQARSDVAIAHLDWSMAARRLEGLERLANRHGDEMLQSDQRLEAAAVDEVVTARWIAPRPAWAAEGAEQGEGASR